MENIDSGDAFAASAASFYSGDFSPEGSVLIGFLVLTVIALTVSEALKGGAGSDDNNN